MGASISIITATYNAERVLPRLADSLRAQTKRDFEWIVVDGASTDRTLDMIREAADVVTVYRSEPDCGIYDALNKALALATGEYYLVMGADDRLAPDAIDSYAKAIAVSGADVITARVNIAGKVASRRHGPPWLFGQFAYVAGHSVGTLFKRDLHERFGDYSRRFPVAADQLFIKTVFKGGASHHEADFVAGDFGDEGRSSQDVATSMAEFFRVQLETERKWPQVILYIIRLIRHFRRL